MQKEIWSFINGFGTLYQASNLGRIKSFHGRSPRILKTSICNNGYHRVSLRLNNIESKRLVHRLVAESFINNPLNLMTVNHIDENKSNNNVINLEWVSQRSNSNHSCNIHGSSKFSGVSIHRASGKWRSCIQFNGQRINLGYFDDEIEASEAYLNFCRNNNINLNN